MEKIKFKGNMIFKKITRTYRGKMATTADKAITSQWTAEAKQRNITQ